MTVCKHYQNGFCKYRQQCEKKHISEMCPSSTTCQNMECERRHPRLCRVFARFRHCKFKECAYLHVQDGNITHIDKLGKEIVELKEHVKDMSKLVESLNERYRRMDIEVKIFKESLANVTKTCEELSLETKKIRKEMDDKKKTS